MLKKGRLLHIGKFFRVGGRTRIVRVCMRCRDRREMYVWTDFCDRCAAALRREVGARERIKRSASLIRSFGAGAGDPTAKPLGSGVQLELSGAVPPGAPTAPWKVRGRSLRDPG